MKSADIDRLVVRAIIELQPNASGAAIADYLHRTRRWRWLPGPGSGLIYPALARLEQAGMIRGKWGSWIAGSEYRRRLYEVGESPGIR